MTVFSALSWPHVCWLPERSLPSLPTYWWLRTSWLLKYIADGWSTCGLEITALNRSRLSRQTHLCNRQMSKAKSAHYSEIVAELSGDYRLLWKAFNKILHRCPKMRLPDDTCIDALTNKFSSFFINIISIICSSFSSDSCSCMLNPPKTRKVLQNLSSVTNDGPSSCSVGSLQIIWPWPYTYLLSLRLYWYSSITDNINSKLIALWRLLPFTFQFCSCLPSIAKAHPWQG